MAELYQISVCALLMAVARSCCGGITIRYVELLPALWMTSLWTRWRRVVTAACMLRPVLRLPLSSPLPFSPFLSPPLRPSVLLQETAFELLGLSEVKREDYQN